MFRLKAEDVKNITKRINPKSGGGNLGINNDLLLWMMDNDQ